MVPYYGLNSRKIIVVQESTFLDISLTEALRTRRTQRKREKRKENKEWPVGMAQF
jgi:hypothetical protein